MKLSDIQSKAQMKPPRLLIYGGAGLGKTTFGATLPSPIFVQVEDGLGVVEVDHFPRAKSFEDVMAALEELASQEHKYRSVVIDSLDWLEPMVWDSVCKANGKNSIEEFGYGKGYVEALAYWRRYIDALSRLRDERNMVVCQIAHSIEKRIQPPGGEPYDRYEIKLNKKASDLVQEHSDVVGFCNTKTSIKKSEGPGGRTYSKATSTGERFLFTHVAPDYIGKNRYGITSELPLAWNELQSAITGKPQKKDEPAKEAPAEAAE